MSIKPYPKYKDSGVEWLGMVPEGWEVKRLKRIFSERDERSQFGDELLLSVSAYTGVSPRSEIVDDGEILSRAESLVGYKNCYVNDLVVNIMLAWNRGLAVTVHDGIVSPAYCVYRIIDGSIPRFLNYLVRSDRYTLYFKAFSSGVIDSRLRIYPETFGRLFSGLPPLHEQSAIASFLDHETAKIDALISEQEKLIELLKEKRSAVISHAVTKGLNPKAKMKPSGIEWLGDVPHEWIVTKMGRAVFMQEGPGLRNWQFTDEGTRVICVTNITEAGIDFARLEKFISTEEYNSSYRHFTVRRGDVLLSSSGNSWGKVAIYEGDEEVILNTSTIRLNESDGAPINRDYIAIILQSDTVREQLGLAMTGSCQPNFGPTHLNCVMVAIPSRGEQTAIGAFIKAELAKFDTLTTEAQHGIDLLEERRSALISAAVTGQIDVRDFNPSKAA